jgi:hypothetical protein
VVVGEDVAECGIAQEPRKQIIVAVLKSLAVNGGVLAALDEDQARLPTEKVLTHGGVLDVFESSQMRWSDAGIAGLATENGGEHPQMRIALSEGQVVLEDRRDGVVDGGGKRGNRSAGRERPEEGRVGRVDWKAAVGGEGVTGEVGSESEGQDAERGGGPGRPVRQREGMVVGKVDGDEGECKGEEAECGDLLVKPARALEVVSEGCGYSCYEEQPGGLRDLAPAYGHEGEDS